MRVAVTGGARGIGLAIASAFAARGASVLIGDLDPDASSLPAGVTAHRLDVRDRVSFQAFLDAAGELDVLVNNAGVAPSSRFVDADPAALDLTLDVNLRGVVNGMRLALPPMLAKRSGHVVNIASLSGRIPLPGAAVYTATKHGVVGLTEAVRAEIRGSGVKLTAVLPTFASTDVTAGVALAGPLTVSVPAIAAAVVRAVRRGGPSVVTVPRWLGALPRIAMFAPVGLRDAIATRRWDIDSAAREQYETRVARQLDA